MALVIVYTNWQEEELPITDQDMETEHGTTHNKAPAAEKSWLPSDVHPNRRHGLQGSGCASLQLYLH